MDKLSSASGFFKGRPAPIDSVKKTLVVQGMKVRIDRPKGFVMEGKDHDGKPWRREYKVDYGFLPKTNGGDGEGVDVFVGPDTSADEAFWVIQKKHDGDFDEYKVILQASSKQKAKQIYAQHVPLKFFGGMVTMKTQMMRALLNKEPLEKVALRLGFEDELATIILAL